MIKNMLYLVVLFTLCTYRSKAQDSLITNIAKTNYTTFEKTANGFTGEGWDKIVEKSKLTNNVLVGEDHFCNEIPFFVSNLSSQIKFDNFFCEIDPFTAKILQNKIKNLTERQLTDYKNEFGNLFSFYAYQPDFALLQQLVKSGTSLNGTDQILLIDDQLICRELEKTTANNKAKLIYKAIADSSAKYFSNFLKNQSNSFYMLSTDFDKKLAELDLLKLSASELKIIESLKLSAKIYKTRDHHLRIQLMKNQLMALYSQWANKKNLFRYGANHLSKGESWLEIYDIGNLVNNIADSEYSSSLHVMILGKSGTTASPFKGVQPGKVNTDSETLKSLAPLLNLTAENKWYCFDMKPLQKAISAGKITVNNPKLLRVIKGYDLLVIIPTVTASKFITD